jgi:hypothetical protein
MRAPRFLIAMCVAAFVIGLSLHCTEGSARAAVTLDGVVSSNTGAANASSINVSHTTGTGADRLMLVGVSWNCGTTNRTISSVTFTPNGGAALGLTEVITQLGYNSSNPRYSAIYRLLNPPSGASGTLTVTFSGSVTNGIVAGIANFAGVDQTTPLRTPNGANGNSTAASVTLTGLGGYELVFDNVFQGASDVNQTLTAGPNQSQLWTDFSSNTRAAASTEQATGSSVTMSWTAASSSYWAIAAVAIIPTNKMPSYSIVLGRPTDQSIAANAIMDQSGEISYEYGTASGPPYGAQTSAVACTAGEPIKALISGLTANTKYYYRPRFRATSADPWSSGDEHSFHTQRSLGNTFKFTMTSDAHLGQTFSGNTAARWEDATLNVAADNSDFHIDLGDTFIISSDLGVGSNVTGNQSQVDAVYLAQRPYFGNFSHSTPLFLAIGNHENEEGWNLDDTPFSRGLASINARKKYFLNPIPDGFYTGNTDTSLTGIAGTDKHREDYYAWTWGDALFIVLDPFQYTMTKPYGTVTGSGEDNDETVSGDQWNWTLGQAQYNWFKQTLQNSSARFKFVFSHHVVGGQPTVSNPAAGPPTYVRGGAMAADFFEWGGYEANGTTWGFNTKRSGWGNVSIHQLMIDNGVSAFFHGHDHQFVHEEIDGIVYQLVPGAGMNDFGFDLYDASTYVIPGGNLASGGHLRVTVTSNNATVAYVGTDTGQDLYSYTIAAAAPQPLEGDIQPVPGDCDVDGRDLAALISDTGKVGLSIFAGNFGKNACPN